ncbi:MAG: damage-inducible protein DinB [Acidobacteria bacterium]|nr:damage-inducible protein DinB [Acidobacteriota bacterium]
MTRMIDPLLAEMEQEAATTRRVLERVPNDKLGWKPHPKSMSLGQLALHVATTPGSASELLAEDVSEVPEPTYPAANSAAELVPALEESIKTAKRVAGGFDDKKAMGTWKLMKDGKEVMAAPRIAVVRMAMLSHWIHHRGQLSVYLRLLDVPVPSIYGPSADENPFE